MEMMTKQISIPTEEKSILIFPAARIWIPQPDRNYHMLLLLLLDLFRLLL
jgi:hypothetical protein